MPDHDTQQVRTYLDLITRGRLDDHIAQLEKLRSDGTMPGLGRLADSPRTGLEMFAPSGLEAAGAPEDLWVGIADKGLEGMKELALGRDLAPDQLSGLEAIIDAELRPAIDIINGDFSVDHPLWTGLNTAPAKGIIRQAIPSVGRIELPGSSQYPYGGTGFVVGDGLIMTNRHVAEIFATGLGDRRLRFLGGARAGIDFRQELGRPTGPTLMVTRVVMIHPYWDMALLAVEGLTEGHPKLTLSQDDARDLNGHTIFVVGYPAFDGRNPTSVQQDVFRGKYGVKRLQPGELKGRMDTGSFGKVVPAATHDCSTLGGNSGSAVFDLATGNVLALHFAGLYHQRNYAVPVSELARDSRVVDAGVNFGDARPAPARESSPWQEWWTRADASEAPATAGSAGASAQGTSPASPPPAAPSGIALGGNCSVSFEIPLRITVSLGQSGPTLTAISAPGREGPAVEAEVEKVIPDPDYSSRPGYDPGFLGGDTPIRLPQAANPAVLASLKQGGTELKYQTFSVMMHAQRRLALLTAANVTREPALKQPEPGRDYSRKGLGGSDRDVWYYDQRLDTRYQLPEVFFTKDRGAFDKGHIARRDDVAFGKTYDLVRRANLDSFHVTNCSPQIAGFNRADSGVDNWGDLEDLVQEQAVNERLCLFAGPVLDPADRIFVGVGESGTTLQAKIPSRFWKVVVARVSDGLAAFGFVLEQDLRDVPLEFIVAPAFVPALYRLQDIETMTGVRFADEVRNADQYDTVRGAEIVLRGGNLRRRRL